MPRDPVWAETEEQVAQRDLREHGKQPLAAERTEHSNAEADPAMNRWRPALDRGDTFMQINPEDYEQQGNPDEIRYQREHLAEGGDTDGGDSDLPPPPPGSEPLGSEGLPPPPAGSIALPPPPAGSKPLGETPSYTKESPFAVPTAKTQDEFDQHIKPQIEALPGGSFYRTPEGKLFQRSMPEKAVDQTTGRPIDYAVEGGQEIKPPSTTAAFGHAAARSALPAAAGIASFEPGFAAGAALGAMTGPAAPVASPVLGLVGGAATAYAGSEAVDKAQDWLLSHLPDSAREYIGQSERQRQEEAEAHPWAQKAGAFTPNLLAFRPGAVPAAAEGAGAMERLLAHPIAGRAVPATIMGAQEAAGEAVQGEPLSPTDIGLSAVMGGVLNKPTALGERLLHAPSAALARVTGRGDGAPSATPPAGGTPPPGGGAGPAPGDTFGMDVGRGGPEAVTVDRLTPDGDVVLKDGDGTEHRMTTADVAKYRSDLPPPSAAAPPGEPAAEPAAEPPAAAAPGTATPPAEGLPGENEPLPEFGTEFGLPTASPGRSPEDALDAGERQATVAQAPGASADLAQQQARVEQETTQPAPAPQRDVLAEATQLLQKGPLSLGQLRSSLKLSRPDFDALQGQLSEAGMLVREGKRTMVRLPQPGGEPVQPSAAVGSPEQQETLPAAPSGALPPVPQGMMRLYRGEGADNEKGGGWFTTDPAKAALYGRVSYLDVNRDDLMHFAQGHGGEDEWLTDNAQLRDRAQPVSDEAQAAAETWANHRRGAVTAGTEPEPSPFEPEHAAQIELAQQIGEAAAGEGEPEAEEPAPAAQPLPDSGFRTAKGSVYEVHEDGTTTRNKSFHPEHGPEDVGLKPRSAKTIYVDSAAAATNLSGASLAGVSPEGFRLVTRDGKASLVWKNQDGRWGTSGSSRDIPFTTKPEVGKYPVEMWKAADDVPGFPDAYRIQHAGNEITELRPGTPSTAAPEPAAEPPVSAAPSAPEPIPTGIAPEPAPRRPPMPPIGAWADQVFEAYRTRGAEAAQAVFNGIWDREAPPTGLKTAFQDAVQKRVEDAGLPFTRDYVPEGAKNLPVVSDEKHTKSGKDIYFVRFAQKPDLENLSGEAKKLGGQWSSYQGGGMRKGWMFKTREAADKFAAWARGKMGAPEAPEAAPTGGYKVVSRTGGGREVWWIQRPDGSLVGTGPRGTGVGSREEAERVLPEYVEAGKLAAQQSGAVEKPVEAGDNTAGPAEPLAPDEHPGLIVKSLETGKTTRIQPPGTRPPEAESVPSGMDPELYRLRTEVAQAREDTEKNPSDAQKDSGTYKKGRVHLGPGLDFVMENPEGSMRTGVDPDGNPWQVELPADYGYFARTRGADDEGLHHKPEGVDAYLGPDLIAPNVFVIDQVHADSGAFDEHKVLFGFDNWAKARAAYENAFSDERGPERIGNVTALSREQLRTWMEEGDTRNPIGAQELPLHGVVGEQEQSGAARAPEPAAAQTPQLRLADTLAERLGDPSQKITARDLQALGEQAYGAKLSEGKFTRAELYDALELAVNKYIRTAADRISPNADLDEAKINAQALDNLKERLPTQTVRAGEKDSMQQFSTPPDYAYAVARTANIGPADRVLEPSAGTGSIAVHAMNAHPAEMIVNELSANRAPLVESLGPSKAFRENAEQLHNILPGEVNPSVVVMNPPFSQTAGRMGDKTVPMTGARHIEQALNRLEPGGRLVAIVGRGMRPVGPEGGPVEAREGTGATFRDWWARIGSQYDVRANIGVSGDVYGKYGTTFPTQLLVIDKTPPSGRPLVAGRVDNIPDLLDRLEEVRNERPRTEPVADQPSGAAQVAGGQGAARPAEPVPGATPSAGVRTGAAAVGPRPELPVGPRAGGEPTDRPQPQPRPSDAVAAEQPERGGPGGAERQPQEGAGERPDLAGSGAEPDAMVLRPEGEPGSVLPASPEELGPGTPQVVRVDEAAADPETAAPITENVYEPYQPQRITIKGAVEHPTPLVQTAAMASVLPPDVSYTPKLPAALVKEGKLSAAQLEAVIYAGAAHSQMLEPVSPGPNMDPVTYRRGFFIGDGTGVGKGAQVAGIILDNWNQGRKKAVWVSESRDLIKDAARDWQWVGRDPKNELFDLGKTTKSGGDIKGAQGIAFLTYDTLKGAERLGKDAEGKTLKGKTRVDQLVDWLGKDFAGVIAFDESHNLANSIATKGTRGMKEAAQKALAGIELQQKLPNARFVYVSATGATEVNNLAYAERLGLWGPGTAFPDKAGFLNGISKGGVAAMELVARDMKALGLYMSRNLSYDGVEYDRVEHTLSADQKRTYDDLAEGWQTVLRNMEEALLKTTGSSDSHGNPIADKRQRTDALSAFWSGHQRFFNQIITSMQMPSVIKGIERDLKEGKQAVLQLVNTNEASQERAINKARAEESDLEDLDMTPRDQLMQLIDKAFPTIQKEEYTDDNGNVLTRPVVDSNGQVVHNPEAVRMKQRLLDKLGSIRVPDGPLELLINHFGPDTVAEVTGRKQRVVRRPDDKGDMRAVLESRPASSNVTEPGEFQAGKKPVLVFSGAGMTGRSYHADLSSPSADARRSHYLVQAGWRADKAIQGFGRTHRTNQASAPIFHLVTTDLQGQRRFISSIARRLAQLGALTKGERRAGESGLFSARDNLESAEAGAALGSLWRDIQNGTIESIRPDEFQQQTGLRLRDSNGNSTDPPKITQFLNRLLSLKFDMQNHVFGEFEGRLNTAIDRAAAEGTLDVGTETLKADRITKEDERTVHTDPATGAETKYVRLKTETKVNPRQFDDMEAGRHYLGYQGSTRLLPEFYVRSNRSGKILAVSRSNDVTDATTGRIVPQYRLTGTIGRYTFTDRDKIDGYGADRYWERIDDKGQAKGLWDQEVAGLPEYHAEPVHLITGAILPVWDRLPGWPTVYRTQTDAGEKFLGRTVPDSQIDATLQRLGAEGTGRQYSPQQLADTILSGGRATLANGWTLSRVNVGYEPRIELIGPDYNHANELANAGVFTERIGFQTRYFVPTGEDAAKTLEQITQRRPAVEVTQGREGLAETSAAPTGRLEDRLSSYREFAERGEPGVSPHQNASLWLRGSGAATGHEFLTAHDASGEVAHAATEGNPSGISFGPELTQQLSDPTQAMVVHHNHPQNTALSPPDLRQLAFPGLDTLVAHGHSGDVSMARLTPEAAAWLQGRSVGERRELLSGIINRAGDRVTLRLAQAVKGGLLPEETADHIHNDILARSLHAAGVIDYMSSHDIAPLKDFWVRSLVRDATDAVRRTRPDDVPPAPEDFDARVNRSTQPVRPEDSMASLSGEPPEDAAGRSGRAGGDGEGREGAPGEATPGLREERSPFAGEVDDSDNEIARAAARSIPTGMGERPPESFWRTLGSGARSPGAGDHFFNAVNKNFTTPRMKAALDPRSNAKWQAELGKYRDAAERVSGYRDGMESWQGKPPEQWRKLFSAMELLTLEGREVPLDGRSVIVENRDQPLAALSKVGDVVRLTSPEEIKMFTDYRNTMDGVWKDLVAETARQFGWEGVPTARAIQEGAEAADTAGERRRLERAAKIVAAIEYQHRTAYLPLMRHGDYALTVKPKAGTETKGGIPGWDGDGFPPTVMFKLIDSLTPTERAIGGIREGIPKQAQAGIDELRKTFPEGEYDIEHGHMFRSTDAVRNLEIPAIDKLLMLVGNDARSQLRDRLVRTGMDSETARKAAQTDYDKLVDSVLDQVYEERVAGFKRTRKGVPGYDSDFAKSTGQYLSWLASHIADLKARPQIEAADQGIDSHPDPRTRAFWRDWDRRREDYGDQLYGPLARMRQGAFAWLLGMNLATSTKIMLHGPLRGVPILTTGLGAAGRTRAMGDYLKASTQVGSALRVGKNGFEVDFGKVPGLSPAERALFDDSLKKGIVHEQTADEMATIRSHGEEALTPKGRFARRVFDIWTSNVSAADRMVRGAMLLSGYRTAQREGMATINRVWDKDLNWKNAPSKTPEGFAQFLVDHTVGIWGDINRLPAMRSQLGGMVGQFKTYELGYMSNLWHMMSGRMGPEGRVTAALMLGGLGMMGGAAALPFAQDAEGAIDSVWKLISGLDPDINASLRHAMDQLVPDSGNLVVHGPGRAMTGIDWNGIGFGDLVSRNMMSPLDLLGAAASTGLGAPYHAYQRYESEQGELAAARELLPNAAKHMLDALYPELGLTSVAGKSKSLNENQLSDADRAKLALGFQPAIKAEQREKQRESMAVVARYKTAIAGLENAWANATARGDKAGADAVFQRAQRTVADGIRAGAFSPEEGKRFTSELNIKMRQRAHPEIGSKTQQRIESARQAAP